MSLVLVRSAFLPSHAWFSGKDLWLPIEVVQLLHWVLYGSVHSAALYWLMCEEGLVGGRETRDEGRREGKEEMLDGREEPVAELWM